MSYRYIYDPVALNEYKEAISWYLERSELAAVKEVNEKLAVKYNYPFRFRNTYKYYSEVSLKKYPYYIVYLIDEVKKVVIVSSVYIISEIPKTNTGSKIIHRSHCNLYELYTINRSDIRMVLK